MRMLLSRAKNPLGGVALLAIIALLVAGAVGIYTKAFRDEVFVSLRVERAGSQLTRYAPVKIRGVKVGEVNNVTTEGNGAVFELALKPDMVDKIPANVRARVVPKTLLGQRYVQLVIPDDPAAQHIQAGAVIGMGRSQVAAELRTVFQETLSVLEALDPAELNATLNAIATALAGRGDEIGDTLVRLEDYLSELNPVLPTLERDLDLLADFADIYADAAPELLRVLDNTTFTANTIIEERTTIDVFLRDVTTLAGVGRQFLLATGQRIDRANGIARPILDLLARYAPEFPCLFAGLDKLEQRAQVAFGGVEQTLHITAEIARAPKPYQYPEAVPSSGSAEERMRVLEGLSGYNIELGPHCYGLPDPPMPFPVPPEFNGSEFADELNSGVGQE